MNKVILFDVDGVLMHSFVHEPEFKVLWTENLEEDLGVKPSELSKLFMSDAWQAVVTGKESVENALTEFLPTVGYDGCVEEFIQYWLGNDNRVNFDLFKVISDLRKNNDVTLCIATNQEHRRVDYLMNTLNFADHFDEIFYSADIGYTKDNPLFYSEVEKRLVEPKENITFFDDTDKIVEAAKRVGWKAIQYKNLDSVLDNT